MNRISDYQLLKDVYDVVSRLEKKVDERTEKTDARIDWVDSRLSNLEGKATVWGSVGGAIAGVVGSIVTNLLFKR